MSYVEQNSDLDHKQKVHTPNNSINSIIKDILKTRNIEGDDELNNFFSWNLKSLPNLLNLKDLKKATLRIIEAIKKEEKIGIYGDYDVDGTTSCALLHEFFLKLGIKTKLYQPSRFIEGYGVHPSSIDKALEDNISVLITVDCGISNLETADYAKEKKLDLIITDHHKDSKEHIPKAYAVINPNRRDESNENPLKCFAGVSVAFSLALSIKGELEKEGRDIPSIYDLLPFVAIGTICDLAYLNPVNRLLTKHGLKQLIKTNYPGLKLFLKPEDQFKEMIESERCSFLIGPCINSKGRLDHPKAALDMIITKDAHEAKQLFDLVLKCNQERKEIQKKVYEQAVIQVKNSFSEEKTFANVVYQDDWHQGVIGIVASKLVENFSIPAIVFTDSEEKGIIKASARTAGQLDLFKILNELKHHFLKFGGHKAAAGLSMEKIKFSTFQKEFQEKLKEVPEIIRKNQDKFDLKVNFNELNMSLAKQLQLMEPFGQGNHYPIFRVDNLIVESYKILKGEHVKWTFVSKKSNTRVVKRIQGISFNYINKWGSLTPDDVLEQQKRFNLQVDARLQINHFRGRDFLQLGVEKISIPFL